MWRRYRLEGGSGVGQKRRLGVNDVVVVVVTDVVVIVVDFGLPINR